MKHKKIEFRCSALEKKAIALKANKSGLSTSEFCRRSALGQRLRSRLDEEELQAYKLLAEYGNNFVRISNLLKKKDGQFAKEVSETAKAIREHLKRFS